MDDRRIEPMDIGSAARYVLGDAAEEEGGKVGGGGLGMEKPIQRTLQKLSNDEPIGRRGGHPVEGGDVGMPQFGQYLDLVPELLDLPPSPVFELLHSHGLTGPQPSVWVQWVGGWVGGWVVFLIHTQLLYERDGGKRVYIDKPPTHQFLHKDHAKIPFSQLCLYPPLTPINPPTHRPVPT